MPVSQEGANLIYFYLSFTYKNDGGQRVLHASFQLSLCFSLVSRLSNRSKNIVCVFYICVNFLK